MAMSSKRRSSSEPKQWTPDHPHTRIMNPLHVLALLQGEISIARANFNHLKKSLAFRFRQEITLRLSFIQHYRHNPPISDFDIVLPLFKHHFCNAFTLLCVNAYTCMHTLTCIFFIVSTWQKPEPNFKVSQLKYNPPKEFSMQITSAIWFTAQRPKW